MGAVCVSIKSTHSSLTRPQKDDRSTVAGLQTKVPTYRTCGSMCVMDSVPDEALAEMVELMQSMPGAFRGEFQLGFWSGVTEGADAWSVRVEADIMDTEFFLTVPTPSDALRRAIEETKRRIPQPRGDA
jgi:hypothetical protein